MTHMKQRELTLCIYRQFICSKMHRNLTLVVIMTTSTGGVTSKKATILVELDTVLSILYLLTY